MMKKLKNIGDYLFYGGLVLLLIAISVVSCHFFAKYHNENTAKQAKIMALQNHVSK